MGRPSREQARARDVAAAQALAMTQAGVPRETQHERLKEAGLSTEQATQVTGHEPPKADPIFTELQDSQREFLEDVGNFLEHLERDVAVLVRTDEQRNTLKNLGNWMRKVRLRAKQLKQYEDTQKAA